MKRFACVCDNGLFFENSKCMKCNRDVGWCPCCKAIAALEPAKEGGGYVCLNAKCKARLVKCENYYNNDLCKHCVLIPAVAPAEPGAAPAGPPVSPFCDYCRFNRTVANLQVWGNKDKWARIERAKRRALYDFDSAGLPYGNEADGVSPALVFDFKSDANDAKGRFRDVAGENEKVFTGHDNGVITINLKEADPVARETARVNFGEAHRSLVGHFRHEMGHYVWDVAVKGKREPEFVAIFGDHTADYDEALKAYYENGPKPDWQQSYISGYATMHPWEDWAETFANYLDMMATLETAEMGKLVGKLDRKKVSTLANSYANLGLVLNELNRGIGLLDFLPEVLVAPVCKKMSFIHELTRYAKPKKA